MHIYAQLNENKVCVGLSQLSGHVEDQNMVELESLDQDKLWRKYENGAWSAGKYEPVSTAPLTEFEQLKQNQALMQAAIDELILNGGAA